MARTAVLRRLVELARVMVSRPKVIGTSLDRLAFRGGLATERRGGEEGVDIGVACEVVDDGSDGADMELEALGELVGAAQEGLVMSKISGRRGLAAIVSLLTIGAAVVWWHASMRIAGGQKPVSTGTH